jgi:hypothetical protein
MYGVAGSRWGSWTTRRARTTSFFARLVLCSLCASAAATAGGAPAARLKARALYAEGEKALVAGDLQTAQTDFEDAYRTLPNAAVLLKIGECRNRRGDSAGAVEALVHYLTDNPTAKDRTAVEAQIAELRKKPGLVTVTSTPAGAAIALDGADTELSTPSELQVRPGEHTVTLTLGGHVTAEQTLFVEFGSRKELTLTLNAAPVPARAANTSQEGTPAARSQDGYHTTPAFWVAVGGTVAAACVTTVFGVIALDDDSRFQKNPTRSTYDDGRRAAVISDIGLGVAAASAVTAGVLFFTSKGPPKPSDQAFVVGPSFGPGRGGLVGNVRF